MNAFTPRKARRNECIHCGGASPLAEARRGIAPEWVRRCMVQAKSELLSLCVCRVEAFAGPGPRHWSAPGPRACPPQKRHVTYKPVWGPGPVGPRHGTYTEEEPFCCGQRARQARRIDCSCRWEISAQPDISVDRRRAVGLDLSNGVQRPGRRRGVQQRAPASAMRRITCIIRRSECRRAAV